MTEILLTGSKYLIIILFAYFTYISFRVQRDAPEEKKKGSYILQRVFLLLIHALAYLCICVNIIQNPDIGLTIPKVLGFYAGQLVYLVIMSILIPSFISLSKGINNVLCMFLAIGFIFQTRLDFDTSVRQFFIVLFGTAAFLVFVFFCKRAKFLRNLTWIYCIVGMALLLLVLILSRVTKGAKLAIDLGFFSFQPMEFVKILFVMFVASAFHKANNLKTVIITAVAAAIHVLIVVFCRDLGSGLILSIIYVLMLYVATRKVRYLFIGAGGFAAAAFAAYHLFSHVRVRVQVWLDPWTDIDNKGYQIAQSLFAVGTGGWLGSGIFRGSPNHIPVVSNDMVFSAIAEEMGAIFAILLILLCLCFVLMMMRVAIRVNNSFYKLLAFGLGTAYGVQVFLTIGGAIKFIPLTGVNLPFISSGGSSMLASMVFIGIIQALYVISEADVEHEREMIAQGADLADFSGFEHIKRQPHHQMKTEETVDAVTHIPAEERIKKVDVEDKIRHIDPEDF